jgi:predicted acylesterase/phospholipase RssA
MRGDAARGMLNRMSASVALAQGVEGFFTPRVPMPWLQPNGSLESTSYYDSSPLKATLESLVDFDRINSGQMRFSVGAVNVITGNFVYFDNATHTIKPEHIMASGALPPPLGAVTRAGASALGRAAGAGVAGAGAGAAALALPTWSERMVTVWTFFGSPDPASGAAGG